MRALIILSIVSLPALAWEIPCNWTNDTTTAANEAGGGGLFATGGKKDYSITCSACHLETLTTPAASTIDTNLAFVPALTMVGNVPTFMPGQRYQVTVTLTGENRGMSGCGSPSDNINTFALTVEDATGATIGLLESDTGQSSTSCLTGLSSMNCMGTLPMSGGTTFMAGDCHAVAGYGSNRTTWTFFWTAPSGTATTEVTFFWGAVDGDCKMNSLRDEVKEKRLVVRRSGAMKRSAVKKWKWAAR
jgi:hypothetical protein